MKRRFFLKTVGTAGLVAGVHPAWGRLKVASQPDRDSGSSGARNVPKLSPEKILLKDYRPKSLYKIPVTQVPKAKFPVIDMHSHPYEKTPKEIAERIRNMDEVGIEKTIILTGAIGKKFDEIYRKYAVYPNRFELWCDFDYTGYDQSGVWPSSRAGTGKVPQKRARAESVNSMTRGKGLPRAQ